MVAQYQDRGKAMGWRWGLFLLLALALVVSTTGCGDDESANAPSVADFTKDREKLANRKKGGRKKAANVAKAKGAGAAAGSEGTRGSIGYAAFDQDYFYDPRGKRDPFRSFRFVDDGDDEKKDFGPLGDFELGQLELSAVIWDSMNPRALILDPGGRAYIVREGSPIGKNGGQVIHIGDNLVLVKETYENYEGEKTTKDVELRIRLSQGG
jgi:type IV pilus assembly protein PilP